MRGFIVFFVLFASTSLSLGQTAIEQTFPTKPGEEVNLRFEEPHNVRISVYDGREIVYNGTVSINLGEFDDRYQLVKKDDNGQTSIISSIKNRKSIPNWISINMEGEKYTFRTDSWDSPEVQKFLKEKGKDNVNWMSHGPQIEIDIEVKVPRDIELAVESKFGLIEMVGITQQLSVTSKFGGVDLAIPRQSQFDFDIDCEWGEVFTDLDLQVPKSDKGIALKAEQFVARLNGGGKSVVVNSKHGNIYLRAL